MNIVLAVLLAAAAALSASDRAFIAQAMNGNSSEIRQGQIFGDSTDPLVAAFAKRMVTDHSAANIQLIAIADADGMSAETKGQAPNAPYTTSSTHTASLSAQQKANDIAGAPPIPYFTQQIRTHEQAIALYRHEIASGGNAQVVAYAKKALPVIESHLALAKKDLAKEKAEHHG